MRSIDTIQIEIENFSVHDSIEVKDKSVKKGEGSVFHFDPSGNLSVYAFMVDRPYSNFMIVYDSPTGAGLWPDANALLLSVIRNFLL